MFEFIFHYYNKYGLISIDVQNNLRLVCDYYDGITLSTKDILSRIKNKACYSNEMKSGGRTIEFWRGSGNFDICLRYGNNDIDEEFGFFIKEWPYENMIEITRVEDENIYFRIASNIFYSWLSYLWQEFNGFEVQLKVAIIENNSTRQFSLNDFAWEELSSFNYPRPVPPVQRFFSRNLLLEELYSRADLKYDYQKTPIHYRTFQKGNETINISLENEKISQTTDNGIDIFTEFLSLSGLDSQAKQKLFIGKMNNLTNGHWMDISYLG